MMSAANSPPDCRRIPLLGKFRDMVCDDVSPAAAQGGVEVAIGYQAQALVPGLVAGREVAFYVEIRPQLFAQHAEQMPAKLLRMASALAIDPLLQARILPAGHRVGPAFRQQAAQDVGDSVHCRPRYHVSGRALQHGDFCRRCRQCWNQGHGSGPGADDHHALVAVVQLRRPMLGAHNRPLKTFLARKGRLVTVGIIEVARAHQQELAAEPLAPFLPVVGGDGNVKLPARQCAAEMRPPHPVAEADLLLHAMLAGGFSNVVENITPVGDRLGVAPGFEVVAQRVHVAV
jgi:hypothetical protein